MSYLMELQMKLSIVDAALSTDLRKGGPTWQNMMNKRAVLLERIKMIQNPKPPEPGKPPGVVTILKPAVWGAQVRSLKNGRG